MERSQSLSFSIREEDDIIDDKYNKIGGKSTLYSKQLLYYRIVPCLVLMFLPWIVTQRTYWQVKSRRSTMEELLDRQKDLIQKLDDTTSNMKKLREDIDLLTKDNEMTYQEIQRQSKNMKVLADHPLDNMESEEYEAMEKDEESLMTRITKLERAIQKNSHKRLTER